MIDGDQRLLTTIEFAAMFRISRVTANRWALRYPKQLGAIKMGRTWRWPESKAKAALINGLHEETTATP